MTLGTFFSSISCYRPGFARKSWGEKWSAETAYQGTSYCGLCRLHFPARPSGSPYDPPPPPDEAWQYKYRGLVCEDPAGESKPVQITEVMSGTPFTDHITIKPPRSKRKLKRFVPTETITYCVHDWCYSAFRWKAKGCPIAVLYRLVRSLSFQASPWQSDYRDRQARSLWGQYPGTQGAACTRHAPAELLPDVLAGLPMEIQGVVWRYADGSAYGAFLNAVVEAASLAKRLRRAETVGLSLARGGNLTAKTVEVFDISYIQSLTSTKAEPGAARPDGLEFFATQAGICMVRLYGKDWQGEWVGERPARKSATVWHGRVVSPDGKFQCIYSDLNLVQITTSSGNGTGAVVWDREDIPDMLDPTAAIFDYDPQRSSDETSSERQPRLLKHLSFTRGRDYMTGLTVYCGTSGGDDGLRITGLEAHFNGSSQLSGSDRGMALYYHFTTGEKIAYIWLRSCGDPWAGYLRPSLAIQTTMSRRYHFGPYLSPEWIEDEAFDPYWWIRLESKGYLTGLYYEQPIHNPYIRSVGVVEDAAPLRLTPMAPSYHNWPNSRCPRWIGTPDKDLYISTTFLDPVERVTMCKVGERCIGMLMQFSAHKTTVLGQWKQVGRSNAQHLVIFESQVRQQVNMYFQMKRYYPRENSTATTISHIVTDIGVSINGKVEMLSGRDYRAFSPGEEMAWWWTDKYDLIKNSSGDISDVPESRTLRQKAFTAIGPS